MSSVYLPGIGSRRTRKQRSTERLSDGYHQHVILRFHTLALYEGAMFYGHPYVPWLQLLCTARDVSNAIAGFLRFERFVPR